MYGKDDCIRLENELIEMEMSICRRFSLGVLDSIPANIAVIAEDGTIIASNKAWAEFAAQHGNPIVQCACSESMSLGVTTQVAGPHSDRRLAIDTGIKAVLHGSLSEFKREYVCHLCNQKHWFQLHVTPLVAMGQKAAVVVHTDISSQKKIECRAKEKEQRYRILLEGVKDYDVVLLDSNAVIATWDTGAENGTRQMGNDVIGQHVSRLYPAEDAASGKPQRELAEAVAKGRIEHEGWRLHDDGTLYWAELVTTVLKDEEGRLSGYLIIQRDISERRQFEASLYSVVDHSVDALVTIDQNGVILSFAGAAQRIFGYQASEAVGRKVNMLIPEPWRGEHDSYMQNYLRTGEAKIIGIGREVSGQRKDGSLIPLELTLTTFSLDNRRFFTGILRDITERKAVQEQLQVQATRDSLTGTWNRTAVLDLLKKELNRGYREAKSVGLVFLDLDHFKRINDTYGHQAGDAVLRAASEQMRRVTRPYDLVGRYGGEEFLIVLPGCEETNLRKVCERLRKSMEDNLVAYEQNGIPFTASIGATIAIPSEHPDVESLIRAADLALYRAKASGRNRVEIATA